MSTSYRGWRFCTCDNETDVRRLRLKVAFECCIYFSQTVKFELALFTREKTKGAAKHQQNGRVDCRLTRKNRIEGSLKEAAIQPPPVQLTPWGAAICGGGCFCFLLKL